MQHGQHVVEEVLDGQVEGVPGSGERPGDRLGRCRRTVPIDAEAIVTVPCREHHSSRHAQSHAETPSDAVNASLRFVCRTFPQVLRCGQATCFPSKIMLACSQARLSFNNLVSRFPVQPACVKRSIGDSE